MTSGLTDDSATETSYQAQVEPGLPGAAAANKLLAEIGTNPSMVGPLLRSMLEIDRVAHWLIPQLTMDSAAAVRAAWTTRYQQYERQQPDSLKGNVGDIMNVPTEPYSLIPARAGSTKGHVEIKGISFRYSSSHPFIYKNLSLELSPGKITVLKGPSGSGKSTLAKLLQGFYQPVEGSIMLDGVDLRHMSANELRALLGVVPQETMLFSGTIYENLHLANPHSTFQEVVRACELAEIHAFIKQLPKGYQTAIGEHGVGLSGGQKQRLAIARALLKKPKILIFDEATSNLDQETAEAFAKTINALKGTVTTLFITHAKPAALLSDENISLIASR